MSSCEWRRIFSGFICRGKKKEERETSDTEAQSELSSHQRKIFKVDDYISSAIAGLTAYGRVLSRYLRPESINHSFTYESPLPVGRLVVHLADKTQILMARKNEVWFVQFSNSGKYLATASSDCTAMIWKFSRMRSNKIKD